MRNISIRENFNICISQDEFLSSISLLSPAYLLSVELQPLSKFINDIIKKYSYKIWI